MLSMDKQPDSRPTADESQRLAKLVSLLERRAPLDAALLLKRESDTDTAVVLGRMNPLSAFKVLMRLPEARRAAILPRMDKVLGDQWLRNQRYPDGSVGRLMEPPHAAVFAPGTSVADCVKALKRIAKGEFFTYAYVTDAETRLLGVVTMRDLLLARRDQPLAEIMLTEPYHFTPETTVKEATQEVVHRHYPVYPVCDADGRMLGLVHGYVLFEETTEALAEQAGRLVGVTDEERLDTPWVECFKRRHLWLQINLLTAFLAAAVVGGFKATIEQVVVLAAFLPVLAGQSGNTGCQALAVTIRGLTLDEFRHGQERAVLRKEALLGVLNGLGTGAIAGLAMLWYAWGDGALHAWLLAIVVLLAMVGACVTSGLTGVMVPLTLKRFGVDPATSSSIFLTTATDVVSMGLLLGLATMIVL
jgi:magnesium transporter